MCLNDRYFKIAVLKLLSEMQENTYKQFNLFRKQINEKKKEDFTKEIETSKKNQ